MVNFTDLAKKYGHPTNEGESVQKYVSILRHTGKSGITPVTQGPAQGVANFSDKSLEDYQRRQFFGFTACELYLSRCWGRDPFLFGPLTIFS